MRTVEVDPLREWNKSVCASISVCLRSIPAHLYCFPHMRWIQAQSSLCNFMSIKTNDRFMESSCGLILPPRRSTFSRPCSGLFPSPLLSHGTTPDQAKGRGGKGGRKQQIQIVAYISQQRTCPPFAGSEKRPSFLGGEAASWPQPKQV